MKTELENFYLDYFNNFLTIEKMAEHYGLTEDQVINLILIGKEINQQHENLKP